MYQPKVKDTGKAVPPTWLREVAQGPGGGTIVQLGAPQGKNDMTSGCSCSSKIAPTSVVRGKPPVRAALSQGKAAGTVSASRQTTSSLPASNGPPAKKRPLQVVGSGSRPSAALPLTKSS